MAKSGNSSRTNNADNYRDREDMNRQPELFGEDISDFGKGKGAYRKRLANEIEDNLYDAETVVEVIDDPSAWGEDLQINFQDAINKNYQKQLAKYLKIIKKTYKWLKESETGQQMESVVGIRAKIGMSKKIWDTAVENSEEFAWYSTLIYELIGARIHHLGLHDRIGQIFKIHSIKNHLPNEFMDKKEVSTTGRIDVIQVSAGSKEDVAKAIEESKNRLKE